MQCLRYSLIALFMMGVFQSKVCADIVSLDSTDLALAGVNTSLKAQNLEDELNLKVFNPLGIEFEVAAPTGGTVAVDDLSFEGPGLTIIGGGGFILRFTDDAKQVRVRFGNFKDNGERSLHGFDPLEDFVRSTTEFSQSINGNIVGVPNLATSLDSVTGNVLSTAPLDLVVSDESGRISSIWADTNFFLTSLEEIEVVTAAAVPEPSAFTLLGVSIIFFRFAGRTRKK